MEEAKAVDSGHQPPLPPDCHWRRLQRWAPHPRCPSHCPKAHWRRWHWTAASGRSFQSWERGGASSRGGVGWGGSADEGGAGPPAASGTFRMSSTASLQSKNSNRPLLPRMKNSSLGVSGNVMTYGRGKTAG